MHRRAVARASRCSRSVLAACGSSEAASPDRRRRRSATSARCPATSPARRRPPPATDRTPTPDERRRPRRRSRDDARPPTTTRGPPASDAGAVGRLVDGQPGARDRRLDPGVDLRPLRRPAVRPARADGLGGRGRRRDRPVHRVRAQVLDGGSADGWDAAVVMLGNNYGGDPQAFGRELDAAARRARAAARSCCSASPASSRSRTRSTTSSRGAANRARRRAPRRLGRRARPRTPDADAARRRRAAPERRRPGRRWRR